MNNKGKIYNEVDLINNNENNDENNVDNNVKNNRKITYNTKNCRKKQKHISNYIILYYNYIIIVIL